MVCSSMYSLIFVCTGLSLFSRVNRTGYHWLLLFLSLCGNFLVCVCVCSSLGVETNPVPLLNGETEMLTFLRLKRVRFGRCMGDGWHNKFMERGWFDSWNYGWMVE